MVHGWHRADGMPERMDTNIIPEKEYRKIVGLVPLVCVDVVLAYRGKYILVKRATEPLKGLWWVVGGRLRKGETTRLAAKRKVWEEVGLHAKHLRLLGVYEESYPTSAWGVPTSSVSVVYSAEVERFSPTPDETVSAVKLAKSLPARFRKHLNA